MLYANRYRDVLLVFCPRKLKETQLFKLCPMQTADIRVGGVSLSF